MTLTEKLGFLICMKQTEGMVLVRVILGLDLSIVNSYTLLNVVVTTDLIHRRVHKSSLIERTFYASVSKGLFYAILAIGMPTIKCQWLAISQVIPLPTYLASK